MQAGPGERTPPAQSLQPLLRDETTDWGPDRPKRGSDTAGAGSCRRRAPARRGSGSQVRGRGTLSQVCPLHGRRHRGFCTQTSSGVDADQGPTTDPAPSQSRCSRKGTRRVTPESGLLRAGWAAGKATAQRSVHCARGHSPSRPPELGVHTAPHLEAAVGEESCGLLRGLLTAGTPRRCGVGGEGSEVRSQTLLRGKPRERWAAQEMGDRAPSSARRQTQNRQQKQSHTVKKSQA